MAILQYKRSKMPNKLFYNCKNTLIFWIWNLKCVCQHLQWVLERSWKLKPLSKCYQIVAQCLRNK